MRQMWKGGEAPATYAGEGVADLCLVILLDVILRESVEPSLGFGNVSANIFQTGDDPLQRSVSRILIAWKHRSGGTGKLWSYREGGEKVDRANCRGGLGNVGSRVCQASDDAGQTLGVEGSLCLAGSQGDGNDGGDLELHDDDGAFFRGR